MANKLDSALNAPQTEQKMAFHFHRPQHPGAEEDEHTG